MSASLEATARQTHFVVREGAFTKKVTVTFDWRLTRIEHESELDKQLQLALSQNLRTVIVVSEEDLRDTARAVRARLGSAFGHRVGILVVAKDPAKIFESGHEPFEFLDAIQEKDFRKSIDFYLRRAVRILLRAEDKAHRRLNQRTLEKLNEIFIALSAERNPEKLLATILMKALELGNAESGILYMVTEKDGELYFRLKIANDANNQVSIDPIETKVVENSICGFVTLTGKLNNVKNVSEMRPMTLPQILKSVDYYVEGQTRTVLTVPLKNSRNEVIATLQLANRKADTDVSLEEGERETVFEAEDESLLSSFATQAAICLENVDLYRDIQRLFEGFVRASITAIESRDPSTGGHSERVAKLSVALARATTEVDTGIYRSVKFKEEEIRELEYAALLHDFGKIGVREEVLVKAKKLYTWQLDAIKERIKICKAAARIYYLERKLKQQVSDPLGEKEFMQKIQDIETYWQIIQKANEPAILKKESMEALDRIRNEQLLLPDGSNIALLTEDEYKALAVTQGSLTESERLEIESHVRHTYQFLKMIPWTRDFKHLPEIAYCHHEKLDGTGYPRSLTSHEIPLQSKIMTIADIFDALTAADRWYKEAVPTERALDILNYEVNQGKLDPVLFEIFVQRRIFEVNQPKIVGVKNTG